MDSHDFSLRKLGDTYYMTSIAYGLCMEPKGLGCDQTADHCGFQPNHTINVWSSKTLASGSWEFVTQAIDEAQRVPGTIFRPDGIWNPATSTWVLWYNAPDYQGYTAYTAPGPAGPYTLARARVNVTIQNSTENCGDFHLFIDPADGTPYVIAGCGFHMFIEKCKEKGGGGGGGRRVPRAEEEGGCRVAPRPARPPHAPPSQPTRAPTTPTNSAAQHARQRGRCEPDGPLFIR